MDLRYFVRAVHFSVYRVCWKNLLGINLRRLTWKPVSTFYARFPVSVVSSQLILGTSLEWRSNVEIIDSTVIATKSDAGLRDIKSLVLKNSRVENFAGVKTSDYATITIQNSTFWATVSTFLPSLGFSS